MTNTKDRTQDHLSKMIADNPDPIDFGLELANHQEFANNSTNTKQAWKTWAEIHNDTDKTTP